MLCRPVGLVLATLIVESPAGFRNIHHVCGTAVSAERKPFFLNSICFIMQNFCLQFLCSQIYQVVPVLLPDLTLEGNFIYPWLIKGSFHVFSYNVVSHSDPLDIHTGVYVMNRFYFIFFYMAPQLAKLFIKNLF